VVPGCQFKLKAIVIVGEGVQPAQASQRDAQAGIGLAQFRRVERGYRQTRRLNLVPVVRAPAEGQQIAHVLEARAGQGSMQRLVKSLRLAERPDDLRPHVRLPVAHLQRAPGPLRLPVVRHWGAAIERPEQSCRVLRVLVVAGLCIRSGQVADEDVAPEAHR